MTTVVTNPVAQIVAARRRLKQVAALRAGLTLFVPALTALLLAATLAAIGARTWERWGYMLPPARLDGLRLALLIAGVGALAGCTLMAWRAYRETDDLVDAAGGIEPVFFIFGLRNRSCRIRPFKASGLSHEGP